MSDCGDTPVAKRNKHEKPSADVLLPLKKSKKRTVSIAVCASMLENLKGEGAKHRIIAQIARAAVIFRVNEVVVIDDAFKNPGFTTSKDCNLFKLVLEYLECPQYLRKVLFPMCLELRHIGVAPPLDAPHQARFEDEMKYREGVLTRQTSTTAWINVGLENEIQIKIDSPLPEGKRLTVQMETQTVVDPVTPRVTDGLYWGYRTRVASKLSQVISECPFENGYDLTIGTSERGETVGSSFELGKYRNLLIVFGGPKGLEHALQQDKSLESLDDPRVLFDKYLNSCPHQGSRTIRTEEAVLITLATLQSYLWK